VDKKGTFCVKILAEKWTKPHPLQASPPIPTGLTHSPYWPHPQPLSKGRGEWYVLLVQERFSVDEKTC